MAYLSQEVLRWSAENHCFSCHNNGDAARALYLARRLSIAVPDASLSDTTGWLNHPDSWEDNKGPAGFADKKLARIEFANAAAEAFDAGVIRDPQVLAGAARPLLQSQDSSGAWLVDAESAVASPATYGPVLATFMARRALERAEDPALASAIRRADEWMLQAKATSVMNSAALVMAFAQRMDDEGRGKVEEGLDVIRLAQSRDGGWGPYPNAPTEPFDTAITLLALQTVKNRPEIANMIARGRAFLIENQLPEGGWIETTRPAGGRSYAEHISTTGWAAIALMRTR